MADKPKSDDTTPATDEQAGGGMHTDGMNPHIVPEKAKDEKVTEEGA